MVSGLGGFQLVSAEPLMRVVTDPKTAGTAVMEGETRVLQFNHQNVEAPVGTLEKISAANQKYARARGDYIHPLYGPSGEEITTDWAVDHPHHRGIYWAWPEVRFGDQTGDLHALQRVFARPVGIPVCRSGDEAASIEASSDWMWEDKTPIVREMVSIRVEKAGPNGRRIDLSITLDALADGVSVARRETNKYGGLNNRFAGASSLAIAHHADPAGAVPRMAWHRMAGTWSPATSPASVTIFEMAANPGYPADHIEYPELAWFQAAFPKAGTRHALKKGEPLVLQYRYLIQDRDATDEKILRDEWLRFNNPQPTP